MPIPTDRGYVVIRSNPDRTSQVEIYAQQPAVGVRPFAVHSGVDRIVERTRFGFSDHQGGKISRRQVEVSYSETDDALYLHDLAATGL